MPNNKEYFQKKLNEGKNFVVWEELPTDTITPVSCLMNLSENNKYYCLFESVTGGETKGRYSIIAFDPDILWKCEEGKTFISGDSGESFEQEEGNDVFANLKGLVNKSKIEMPPELPDMSAGIFGFMGYDMVKLMEDLPDKNPANIDIPDSIYFRPRIVIVFDNVIDKAFLVHSVYKEKEAFNYDFDSVSSKIDEVKNNILQPNTKVQNHQKKSHDINFESHISKEDFCNMVDKCIEYIKAGDIFQIVPSRRFSADYELSPISFYRSLRSLNPSPYLFLLHMDNSTMVGSSPEILVKVEDGEVTIRPLAGTRKRGNNEQEDKELEDDLLSDKKELAEHLMLLDLGRNDVGRVAVPGSIEVSDKMTIERYSHVMHIVSNVSGKMSKENDYMDALIAGFPAGTVSGAPKIRTMEIIDEIETEKRQFYAGTVGYFSATGNLDTCIALRTALIKDKKIYVQAGAGVVYDSIPENEYLETENKAMALIKAAREAINYE